MRKNTPAAPRSTRQKDAIRAVIAQAAGPLSPLEILEHARARVPGLGIATVYRVIKQLVAENHACTVSLPGETDRYEFAEGKHHHHFQCTSCRRVYDIDGCPGGLRKLAPRGFSVETHDLTLYGRCRACR